VLLALFLLASHAKGFTSLSSVAGDQVRVNHLIRLQQPLSKPTNKPSCEPIRKPTKRMDLDAKLQNNLSPTKTRVAYSEPKQDAELPIKVTFARGSERANLRSSQSLHNVRNNWVSFLDAPVRNEQEIVSTPAPVRNEQEIVSTPAPV
jgi:hypothetical protein